ncbi:hypothetical protein DPSP01_003602 [Paraphaeosphaeria sporulosa]|uniref:Uncharacterized protein n=1 Tax=Paraphaeosphaeria sporulosa TaxID=1460663 RepID=A0A177BXN2_9PLEO|nr:uncharacterized protein CC84DRAFT_1210313 [Paraphaeosphaeria sporulosa]OAF99461.1 hypothetical protein CC84DRAFT_1210313 [Paraphaeosphaeria sporulosa]
MGVFSLIFLFLALYKYACADDGYHNRAMWFVGNTTVPPPTENEPDKSEKVGTTVINGCNYPVYIWEAWESESHQTFKRSLPARSKETYKIIDNYLLPGNKMCTDNCGVTYKLSKPDGLVGGVGGNQVQFEYSTRKGLFY